MNMRKQCAFDFGGGAGVNGLFFFRKVCLNKNDLLHAKGENACRNSR